MKKGPQRDRIRFERPVSDDAADGAGSGQWQLVCEMWANVQDMLPSRGERLAEGINVAARPARIRCAYRDGITSDMRILVGRNMKGEDGEPVWRTDRTMQIVSGPARLGRREGLEIMAEEYSHAGSTA